MSHFNVCYWRHTAAAIKRRQRYVQWGIASVGFSASMLYLILTEDRVKSVIGAVSSLLASFFGAFPFKSDLAQTRVAAERWSELATDADTLWQYAEARGWEGTAVAESLEGLRERERQFQAREDHVPNDSFRKRCYRLTCSELQVQPIGDDHVEAETAVESAESAQTTAPTA